MNITITGAGYVGLVTGVCLSSKGHSITMIDIDRKKIERMKQGEPTFYEKGLPELMRDCRDKMDFTTDPEEAYKAAEVVMLAVATPERRDGSANLTHLFDACAQILSNSEKGCTIVIKSTVPVGTCDKIEQFMDEKKPGSFRVVSNPEFLAQGSAIDDTLYPSRIVVGAEDSSTASLIKEIYKCFESEFILTDRKSAEMIKYASNDFLALKLSYINEIANLCEIVGADIDTVSHGMGLDPRIGQQYLGAGTGYGGSCFPKDTKALHWLARYHDYELKTIKATIEVNENQKVRLFKKAKKYFKCFRGLTVAILGLSFKPGTDDLREAPSVEVIQLFIEEGAEVRVWDPVAIENFLRQYPDTVEPCKTIDDTIHNADICLIMTEWDEVKAYAPVKFASLMKTPIVIDGRNCYKSTSISSSAVLYDSIGRKTVGGYKNEIFKSL